MHKLAAPLFILLSLAGLIFLGTKTHKYLVAQGITLKSAASQIDSLIHPQPKPEPKAWMDQAAGQIQRDTREVPLQPTPAHPPLPASPCFSNTGGKFNPATGRCEGMTLTINNFRQLRCSPLSPGETYSRTITCSYLPGAWQKKVK